MIQGIGSAGLLPSATGIVADEFPRSRQQAIGLFTTFVPSGMLLGPSLGGLLVSVFGWRSLFWVNLPFGLAGLLVAGLLFRDGKREKMRLDLAGAATLTASLLAFSVGLSSLGGVLVPPILAIPLACSWHRVCNGTRPLGETGCQPYY